MTEPPLPDVPTLRCRLVYNTQSVLAASNRFFLQYAGAAPTGANCIAIANAIEAAWVANLAPIVNENDSLGEVDVLDIATDSGFSGQWTGTESGSRAGGTVPVQVAANIEFGLARRYRGGKPRMFLPPGTTGDLENAWEWTVEYIDAVTAGVEAFFTAVEAIEVGAVGALTHITLSYYKGFTNITNSSGRERAVPTYRDVALSNVVTSYGCKAILGSQRRRRTSTTP